MLRVINLQEINLQKNVEAWGSLWYDQIIREN